MSLAAPAAAFEWTIPASFLALNLTSPAEDHELLGLQLPVAWVGGPAGPFALHFAGGYAYQRETRSGDNLNFVTVQANLDLEFPLVVLVPYLGIEAMGWYPLDPRDYLKGLPVMAAPHAGVRFSLLNIVALDLWAFGIPGAQNVWNITNGTGQSYTGSAWGAGGRVFLNL
jgi:hypothetical protein